VKLKPHDIARMIDISAVQTPHGEAEIRELVRVAKEHDFISVHTLPCWTRFLAELLKDRDDILPGGPVGFPSGAHRTDIKIQEARGLLADGVREMDLMMNVGMLRSGRFDYVLEEIKAVVEVAEAVPVKVIIEVHYLTDDQIKKACELCIDGGAAFVKTATGWAQTGATLDTVKLITTTVGGAIKVKASGGIRGLGTFVEMYKLGVQRFGINVQASLDILEECANLPDGAVVV
jgi:deoxyribose-phosphate aldolase